MNERATDHDSHDRLLIAAHAAGDAEGPDRERAKALLGSCAECARLAADLRSVAAALPSAAVPRRPRDFRLRLAEVEERPAGGPFAGLRRSIEAFRRSLAPVGAGLATIGIAGLLLAGTTGLLGGSTSAVLSTVGAPVGTGYGTSRDANDNAAGGPLAPGVASPAASAASEQRTPAATAVPGGGQVQSIPTPKPAVPEKLSPVPSPAAPSGPPPLVVGSVVVLGLGVAFWAIGRIAAARAGPED